MEDTGMVRSWIDIDRAIALKGVVLEVDVDCRSRGQALGQVCKLS